MLIAGSNQFQCGSKWCQFHGGRMDSNNIKEIVTRLKAVRIEKGYSYQKIADMTEEIEEAVSLSTVKRVFADSGKGFRWATIKPIATVVLGVGFETPEPDEQVENQPQMYYAEIEALKALVEAKGEMIAEKSTTIDYLRKQLRRQQLAAAIVLGILVIMLLVDLFNRNIGFFWLR